MSITIHYGSVSKRKNSTKRPALSGSFQCLLKDNCSDTEPTFILNMDDFPYNYIKWGSWYYFVTGVTYVRNNLIEVSAELDALATYKEAILDSTQFVSYSNVKTSDWLRDNRLVVLSDSQSKVNKVTAPFISSDSHKYILSVLGKSGGCGLYALTRSDINQMLDNVSSQNGEIYDTLMENKDWDSPEVAIQSLAQILTQTDLLGNAYENAPSCIRSCIWTPFLLPSSGDSNLYLGNYDTHITARRIFEPNMKGSFGVDIPWRYSDWRRSYAEQIYLYLPFVGLVNIPTDEITNETRIVIDYSYTITDGAISYEVKAGNQIIGTYGGSCSASYPIGINQGASIGSIANSLVSGAVKTANTGIFGSIPNVATGVNALATAYETMDTAFSTHPTTIGGIGGGSGAGLDTEVACISVSHSTNVEPNEMLQTMGVPTMKPLKMSQCSGYVQCANAHVAVSAESGVINQIDGYLNSGFYIE